MFSIIMARTFKMFNHIVDPEMRTNCWRFSVQQPLKMFLMCSFAYMSVCLFSYRSLLHSYLGLIIYSFTRSYIGYIMEKGLSLALIDLNKYIILKNNIVMAPFMKDPKEEVVEELDPSDLDVDLVEEVDPSDLDVDLGEEVAEEVAEEVDPSDLDVDLGEVVEEASREEVHSFINGTGPNWGNNPIDELDWGQWDKENVNPTD